MSEVNVNKNTENFGNKYHNFEDSEIDKEFDYTSFKGFKIENLHIIIDSLSIKFTNEEKEKIIKEILDSYKEKPDNSFYTYKKQFSNINENKTYNYQFVCTIKKNDKEKADIEYQIKEINISNVNDVKEKRNKRISITLKITITAILILIILLIILQILI